MPDPIDLISYAPATPLVSLPATQGIQGFQAGDLIRAQVVAADNSGLFINIRGENIAAESSLPINTGEMLTLEFLSADQGILSFRLLNDLAQAATAPFTSQDLESLLTGLQLPVNDRTLALGGSMLEFGIPLTPANFSSLLKVSTAGMEEYSLQAFQFLEESGSAASPENVQVLANFFQQKPEIGLLLTQLQQFAATQMTAPEKFGEIMRYLPALIADYILDFRNESKEENRERIARLAVLAKSSSNPLSSLLQALEEGFSGSANPTLSLQQILERLGEFLQAQWLLNPESHTKSIYFQIPAPFLGNIASAEVRIEVDDFPEGHAAPAAPKRGKIEFSITTPNLGTIQCKVKLFQDSLAIQLSVENGKEDFVESHLSWLKEGLEKLNHRIVSLKLSGRPSNFWAMKKIPLQSLEKVSVTA